MRHTQRSGYEESLKRVSRRWGRFQPRTRGGTVAIYVHAGAMKKCSSNIAMLKSRWLISGD